VEDIAMVQHQALPLPDVPECSAAASLLTTYCFHTAVKITLAMVVKGALIIKNDNGSSRRHCCGVPQRLASPYCNRVFGIGFFAG
jgi:hypothetical protein